MEFIPLCLWIVQKQWLTVSRKQFLLLFFHLHCSPLWALACRTMPFHIFLSATNSLHLLTPSTWRSLSTSSVHLFLGLPLLLVPSSSWVKIFLDILSYSTLSRWPNQLILCPFIHFTIFSPLLISSSSRFVPLFHSPFPYSVPYILLNIFLSKISRACSSFFVNVHASAPHDTTGRWTQLLSFILVQLHVSVVFDHQKRRPQRAVTPKQTIVAVCRRTMSDLFLNSVSEYDTENVIRKGNKNTVQQI